MEGLFVDGIDRHLRRAEQRRIIKRADLQNNEGQTRPPRHEMSPAFAAKFARHRVFEIGTREFARFAARDPAQAMRQLSQRYNSAFANVRSHGAPNLPGAY